MTMLKLPEDMQQPGMSADKWLAGVAANFTDGDALRSTWQAWQNGPGVQEGEWTTNDQRSIVARTYDIRQEDGVLLGRLWVFNDVTEKRQMHIRLQESQKMESMGQLAGGIAHDFNNLLTAIRGNLTLAELNENDREGYRSKIDDASRAATRASELVNQILGYSRKGRPRTITDVSQVVSDVRNILRASLDPKVALRVNLPKEPWSAAADPGQIEQVLLNICLNARDALPIAGGNIDISTSSITKKAGSAGDDAADHVGDFVVIKVKDNGSGIPAEARDKIFEPFYTTKAQGKGTGLGLAMARSIVEQVGGWIELDSEVGKGTEFRIFLPRSPETSETKPAETTRAFKPVRSSAEGTILVVDDEAPVRSIAVNMLKYLGYKVLEAQDGEEAISILMANTSIDVVMMDVYMPKLSGRETYRQMQTLGLDVPVIVCSGFMVEPDEFIAMGQGRNNTVDVIQKPYSMEALAKIVAKAIAKGQSALVA
jgi:two-component system cell cycle sensor histidine kinase/response regulator CckA